MRSDGWLAVSASMKNMLALKSCAKVLLLWRKAYLVHIAEKIDIKFYVNRHSLKPM